jgi:hypothetical protein
MAFGLTRKQRGPDRPYTHSDTCKIKLADPRVEILWSELERGIGRRSASADPRTSTWSPPTVVFGSIRSIRPPAATRASASTVTRAILLCSGPS